MHFYCKIIFKGKYLQGIFIVKIIMYFYGKNNFQSTFIVKLFAMYFTIIKSFTMHFYCKITWMTG